VDRGENGFVRTYCAAQGEAGDAGGNLERARHLGEGHLFHLLVPKVFEEALDGAEELLGRLPLLFAIVAGALSPVGSLPGMDGGSGGSLLFEKAGIERLKAFGPVIFAGPIFDGAEAFAKFIGDGLK